MSEPIARRWRSCKGLLRMSQYFRDFDSNQTVYKSIKDNQVPVNKVFMS
jgi:hypothetical protein